MENCPICERNEFEPKYSLKDFRITQEPFELKRCTSCSFILTDTPPNAANISSYYESEEYLEHSNKSEGLFSKIYGLVRDFMFGYKYRIIRKVAKGTHLLDIGAASGQFINFMKNKNYRVEGIELSDKAREYAKSNFGLNIRNADELYNGEDSTKYDLITMWHVLEHLYDLNKVVSRLHDILSEDGVLVIAVPNSDSFDARTYQKYWAAWDVPRHLWHFQPNCFEQLFSKHGFELRKMKMLPFDPLFNALLSERYRHGDSIINIFRAGIIGFLAFLSGLFDVRKASSVVYILNKKDVGL